MTNLFYAIYSPSLKMWRDENGITGPFASAEQFRAPDKCTLLEGDERWVGPIAEGETP